MSRAQTPRRRPRPKQNGFILVSAIMIVLVLSILGASLFKTGPLENSLVMDNEDNLKAFMNAETGSSRSLDMLMATGDLTAVNATTLRPVSAPLSTVPFTLVEQYRPGHNDTTTTSFSVEGPDAGNIIVISTGTASQGSSIGSETRSIRQVFSVSKDPAYDMDRLLTVTGDYGAKKNQTLTGKIVVATAADSAALVSGGVPADSVSVKAIPMPDFAGFIQDEIAGGYTTITGTQIGNSSAASPLVLGQSTNGVYYNSAGVGGPSGHPGYLTVYGTVYILVEGTFSVPKDLIITAGNSSATLIIVADDPGGTGLDFAKQPQNNGVPLIMMTNGDVNFKKGTGESLTNVSIFGNNVSMDKDQTWTYNHSVMDPIMQKLINSGGIPQPGGVTGGVTLAKIQGQWTELNPPRLN